ncbi:hypothetical protein ABPG74_009645 [Tetrahymena malaccensis]
MTEKAQKITQLNQGQDQFILFREANEGINQQCLVQVKQSQYFLQQKKKFEKKLWMLGDRPSCQKQLELFKNFMKRFSKISKFKNISQFIIKQDFQNCLKEEKLNDLSNYWKMIYSLFELITDQLLNCFKNSFLFLDGETDFKYQKNDPQLSNQINNFSVQTALGINCSLSYLSKLRKKHNIKVPKITYIRIEKSINSNLNEELYWILNDGIYDQNYQEEFKDTIQFICLSDADLGSDNKNYKFYKLEKQSKLENQNKLQIVIDQVLKDVRHFQTEYVIITYPFDLEEGIHSSNQKPFFQNKLFKYLLLELQQITNDKIMVITTSDNHSMSNHEQTINYQKINIQKKLTKAIKILKNEYQDEIDLTNSFIRPIQQDQHDSTDKACSVVDKILTDELKDDKQIKTQYNLNQWISPNSIHQNSNFIQQLQNDMNKKKITFGSTINSSTFKLKQSQLNLEIQENKDIYINKLVNLYPLHIQIQPKVKEDKNDQQFIEKLDNQSQEQIKEIQLEDNKQQQYDQNSTNQKQPEENLLVEKQALQQIKQKQIQIQQQQQQQLEIPQQVGQNQLQQQQQNQVEVLEREQLLQEKQRYIQKEMLLLNIKGTSSQGKIINFNSSLQQVLPSGIIKFKMQIKDRQTILAQASSFSCVRQSGQQIEIYLSTSYECNVTNQDNSDFDPQMIYYCQINQNLEKIEDANFIQYKEVEYSQDQLSQRSITCDDQFLYLLNGVQSQKDGTDLEMQICKKIDLVNRKLIQMDQCQFLMQGEETAPIYLFTTQDNIFYSGIPTLGNGDDQYYNLLVQVYDKQQNRWYSHQTRIKEECQYIICSGKEKNSFYQLIFKQKLKSKKKSVKNQIFTVDYYELEGEVFKNTTLPELTIELNQQQFIVTNNNIPGKVMISSWDNQIELLDIHKVQ